MLKCFNIVYIYIVTMFGEREGEKKKGDFFLRTKFFQCLLCYLFGQLLRFLERSVDDVYCLVRKVNMD